MRKRKNNMYNLLIEIFSGLLNIYGTIKTVMTVIDNIKNGEEIRAIKVPIKFNVNKYIKL